VILPSWRAATGLDGTQCCHNVKFLLWYITSTLKALLIVGIWPTSHIEAHSWWDWIYSPNAPTWVLGIGGIIVALFTLGVIYKQTVATETAALAAKASADALIKSERAWVMVNLEKLPGMGFILDESSTDGSGSGIIRYQTNALIRCICSNQGRTPAQIIEKRCHLLVVPPDTPLPTSPNLEIELVDPVPHYLHSNEPTKHDWTITGDGERKDSTVVIYGVVKYRHLFSDHEVQTTFGYRVTQILTLERLIDYPEYNKNT
jgi:hypothetical protein